LRFLVRRSLTGVQRQALAQASQVSFLPMEAIGEQGELDLSSIRDSDQVNTGYTLFFEGDVVVAKITPCFENGKGALIKGLTNGVGFGTTELHVLSPGPELYARFLYYVTASHSFRKLGEAGMTGAAGQKRVPEDFVRDYRILCPPLSMQRAIADYLDRETGRLDALVTAKERVLELLAEKRRALITRAVTRGLNPNAPLRDSGLPWLGQIPMHWETWKVAHFGKVGNGSTPSREHAEYWSGGTFPWLNSSVVNLDEVTEADQFVTELALSECHLPLVQPGSVLVGITGQGKTRGQAAVLTFLATINQHIAYITPALDRVESKFLWLWLIAGYDYLRSVSDDAGGTKGAITCELLAELRVPLPPLVEQRAIVTHIERETGKLDALRLATERTVALLKERRAALIAAAVTGQLDSADSGKLM